MPILTIQYWYLNIQTSIKEKNCVHTRLSLSTNDSKGFKMKLPNVHKRLSLSTNESKGFKIKLPKPGVNVHIIRVQGPIFRRKKIMRTNLSQWNDIKNNVGKFSLD